MPTIAHKRGTRAALVALAGANGLVPWQIYALSDETGRLAIATSNNTFSTFALESEAGGGGGGGVQTVQVQVVIPYARFHQAGVTVVNAAATPSKKLLCSLAPSTDWDLDDLSDFSVVGAPGTGTINFVIGRAGPIVGTFNIHYRLE